MTKIKICGISRLCDVDILNELRPDYTGFVFAERSRRYVSPETASQLRTALDKSIKAAGVFVNADISLISELYRDGTIDLVQLHGSEDDSYIKALREYVDCTIIKAFKVKSHDDTAAANESAADLVLLDSGYGSGQVFDWSFIRGIGRPYFLAGGLNAENVAGAIEELSPFAVDVSSSVEKDGFKSRQKIAEFISAVRNTDIMKGKIDNE